MQETAVNEVNAVKRVRLRAHSKPGHDTDKVYFVLFFLM